MTVERIWAKLLSEFDHLERTSYFIENFQKELEKVKQKLIKKNITWGTKE